MRTPRSKAPGLLAALAACATLAGCQSTNAPLSEDERPVARVNGQPVPRGLFDACLRNSFAPATHQGEEPRELSPDARSRMLDQLLDEQVLAMRARDAGLTVSADALDNFLSELGIGTFDEAHGDASFVERKWLRRYLEDNLLIKQFLETHVTADVDVSESEILAAYEANPADHTRPTRYRLRQIRVQRMVEARNLNRTLRRDGKNFDEVVAQLNAAAELEMGSEDQGRDLGLWTAAQLPEAFASAVEKLEPGRVAKDIKDPDGGYNFLQLVERQEAYVIPFEQVRHQIRQRLLRERSAERVAGFLEQARADATIELVHENLDFTYVLPEAAAARAPGKRPEGES